MKIIINNKQIDIDFYPFRGILSEIARERGVSRQAIQKSASNGNAEILSMIAKKVKERKAEVAKHAVQVVKTKTKEPVSYKERQRTSRMREPLPAFSWGITM